MKKIPVLLALCSVLISCNSNTPESNGGERRGQLSVLLDNYWQERMQLFPTEATSNGDNRYNDKLTITIAESFRDSLGRWYRKYLDGLSKIDSASLDKNDMVSYRLLKYEMQMGIEGLRYPTHYMPMNQFWSFAIDLPQLGSGSGNQPFKTVMDYDNWLRRLSVFPAWADTAIYDMRKGIAAGWVLPRTLVVKMLPQLKSVIASNDTASIFYGPIKAMPESFSAADKQRLTADYKQAIEKIVNPTYSKLYDFFDNEFKSQYNSDLKKYLNAMKKKYSTF